MQHAAVTWVRARRGGVLGFGVLIAVFLSAFTLAGAFFGFEFADAPSEICCKPPDAHFWFGTTA